MRNLSRIGSVLVLFGALALGACATTGTTPNPGAPSLPSTGNVQVDQVVAGVQAGAVTACGFLPTVETVTDIFLSGNPIYSTVSGITKAICAAIKPKAQVGLGRGVSRSEPAVMVAPGNSVPVKGTFVTPPSAK